MRHTASFLAEPSHSAAGTIRRTCGRSGCMLAATAATTRAGASRPSCQSGRTPTGLLALEHLSTAAAAWTPDLQRCGVCRVHALKHFMLRPTAERSAYRVGGLLMRCPWCPPPSWAAGWACIALFATLCAIQTCNPRASRIRFALPAPTAPHHDGQGKEGGRCGQAAGGREPEEEEGRTEEAGVGV